MRPSPGRPNPGHLKRLKSVLAGDRDNRAPVTLPLQFPGAPLLYAAVTDSEDPLFGGRDRAPSVQLESTSWTAAGQGPLSLEFSRQEYWSALPILRHSPQTFASFLQVAETLPDQPVLCRGGYHGQGPQEMLDHLK